MNFRDKTKNELIDELYKLQQEYDTLKTSYEKDITERKKADQNQVSLVAMLDVTPGFVGFADARDTHILYINPSGRKMVGIGAYEDVSQLKIADVHPEWTNKLLREVSIPTAIRDGIWSGECAFLNRDGHEIPVMMVLLAHKSQGGEVLRFSTVSMDITERKQAESRLRQALEWQEAIFEGSRDAIFISDQDSRFVAVNNAASDLTGYSRDQLLKMRIPDIHDLPDLGAYKMYHQRIFGGEEILSEAKVLRSDDTKIDTEFNNRCVSIAGKPYMHTTAHNITERKRADETLRLEKENFRHSLDDSPLGVRIVTAEGNTIYANQTILNFYGYDSLGELQKTPLKKRYTPESYAESQKRKDQRDRGDLSTTNYEISIVRKNGEIRHLKVFRKKVLWDGAWQFQVIYDDITERRQAEEKLVKLNECFLKFGADTLVNINLLVALSGELMGGTCSLYNRLQGGMLCSVGQWNTPPGYQSIDHPEGHLCTDIIKSTGETTVVIRDLQDTSYAQTDPNVRLYRLRTYIGKAVTFNNINIGSLCVVFQRDIIPGNNEIRLMEIIACAIGVEEARKQAEDEIRKSKKLLEDLHKHLNDIRENERALIAREIHDQIGQSLTALKLDINRMKEFAGSNPEAVTMLRGMIELVTITIKDVQRISSDLRPGILDDLGLVSAIEWYCGEFRERTGIKCNLKLDDSFIGDSQKNLIFFRVFQETLTNVIRHARASSVNIKLHQSDKGTTLTIQDNGIGIPKEKIESHKSLGLINMRERVKQFNGKIDFSSKKGDGTMLTIFIPS